tara:strand:+ start:288 stop:611 length:324 start_codon:yes stop_codon:yes gene_type:complete
MMMMNKESHMYTVALVERTKFFVSVKSFRDYYNTVIIIRRGILKRCLEADRNAIGRRNPKKESVIVRKKSGFDPRKKREREKITRRTGFHEDLHEYRSCARAVRKER